MEEVKDALQELSRQEDNLDTNYWWHENNSIETDAWCNGPGSSMTLKSWRKIRIFQMHSCRSSLGFSANMAPDSLKLRLGPFLIYFPSSAMVHLKMRRLERPSSSHWPNCKARWTLKQTNMCPRLCLIISTVAALKSSREHWSTSSSKRRQLACQTVAGTYSFALLSLKDR